MSEPWTVVGGFIATLSLVSIVASFLWKRIASVETTATAVDKEMLNHPSFTQCNNLRSDCQRDIHDRLDQVTDLVQGPDGVLPRLAAMQSTLNTIARQNGVS